MLDKNPFKSIGICGGGKMGTSFFEYISRLDLDIVFYIRNTEKREKVEKKYIKKMSRMKKDKQNSVCFCENIDELSNCDVVFEFINEELESKKQLVNKLIDINANPNQIIALGSSSFVPSRVCQDYGAYNIIGVHFIYPVQFMETVEIIFGTKTDNNSVKKITNFISYIGKKPVQMDEKVGCITTKVLTNIHNDAYKISRQYNITPQIIDDIVEKDNFTAPPFKLSDIVGLDIILNCIFGHYEGKKEFNEFHDLQLYLEQLLNKNCLGKKSGKGFYDYENIEDISSEVCHQITSEIKNLIIDRIKMLYINSCFKLVDGGWTDCQELDRIFCELKQTQEGPAQIVFNLGIENVVSKLSNFYELYGELFKPSVTLKYAAENCLGGIDIDREIRDFKMGTKRLPWNNKDFIG